MVSNCSRLLKQYVLTVPFDWYGKTSISILHLLQRCDHYPYSGLVTDQMLFWTPNNSVKALKATVVVVVVISA